MHDSLLLWTFLHRSRHITKPARNLVMGRTYIPCIVHVMYHTSRTQSNANYGKFTMTKGVSHLLS